MLHLFQWITLFKDNFSYFLVFDSIIKNKKIKKLKDNYFWLA